MNDLQNNKYVILSKGLKTIRKEMSMNEKKVFYIALSKINLENPLETKNIEISRDDILEAIKQDLPPNKKTYYVTDILKNMIKNAIFLLSDKGKFIAFPIFTKAYYDEMKLKIEFNDYALSTFYNLREIGNYITIYMKDMLEMSNTKESARAEELYLHLRINSDTRLKECTMTLNDDELRKILGLPQDAYTSKGIFKRNEFEKYCLRPTLEKLTKTEHVTLIPYKSEKGTDLFERVKINYTEKGYKLRYKVNMNVLPKQTKSVEKETFQTENLNHQTQVQKKEFVKYNKFNDQMIKHSESNTDYDFEALEKSMLEENIKTITDYNKRHENEQ